MQIQPVPFLINRTQAENLGLPTDEANRFALLGTLAAPTPVLGLVLTQFLAQREIDRLREEAPPPPGTPTGTSTTVATMEDVQTAIALTLDPVQEEVAEIKAATGSRLNDLDKRVAAVEQKLA